MRNNKIFIFFICFFLLSGCKLDEYKFINQCEETFIVGLKSPSSYKKIKHTILRREFTRKEFEDYERKYTKSKDLIELRLKNFDRGTTKLIEITALIEYDAINSFNAIIRDEFTCSTVSHSEEIGKVYDHMISINGIPYFDYKYGRY